MTWAPVEMTVPASWRPGMGGVGGLGGGVGERGGSVVEIEAAWT